MGRKEKSLIKRCLGFDMKVKIFDPYVSEDIIKKFGGSKVESLDDGLKTCDYLSLHVPLTKKTKNLKKKSFAAFPPKNLGLQGLFDYVSN